MHDEHPIAHIEPRPRSAENIAADTTAADNAPSQVGPVLTPDGHQLKVTILCHSDKLGGASVVTYRLMRVLRDRGVDARMVVFTKATYDSNVSKISSRFIRSQKFMYERLRIMFANGFDRKDLFKVSIANTGLRLSKHPWVRDADIIMLSWVNQGMISLKEIRRIARLGKPIVWNMHDMWNLTGICHHSHGCHRFEQECGCCPFLHSHRADDLSHKVWLRKQKLYEEVPITFVTVSHWLEKQTRLSKLMRSSKVETIPNAFPSDTYYTAPKAKYERLPIDYSRKLIIMGAARLDDPIKDLPTAIKALNHIFDHHPDVANETMAVFFGDIKDPNAFEKLRFPYVHLGMVNDEAVLRELYSTATVVLSTSLYETLPGTLIEGQAAGCLPVTTGNGGQADIVDHKVNGYIVPTHDPVDIAEGIMWALNCETDRQQLHKGVESRFDANQVADRYIELFNSLLRQYQ